MSGHNKWSQIKRQKEATDKKKGQAFSKFAKNIALAAKDGSDPNMNYKLRYVLDRAKAAGMGSDNIERAIKRGTGEDKSGQITAAIYEGLGPAGSAFIVETASDNTNRTLQEIRQIFSKNNGQLANTGSVAWMFDHRGLILATAQNKDETELAAIDAGAQEVVEQNEGLEIYTDPKDLMKIKDAIEKVGAKIETAELAWMAKQTIAPDEKVHEQIEKLQSALEDNDDVINVYSNLT